ncbi:unnamed protein product [Notodromas monacha]|uniref:Uncharacterized protein n=1 Tax=Notodromas monacha TaxID=399045 RepID=A0A7R9BMD6_9CRUS|nr:unnamed protein product [Notodromas monacha]CAG0917347.1 unnamed protein product [Notodromas monacha]
MASYPKFQESSMDSILLIKRTDQRSKRNRQETLKKQDVPYCPCGKSVVVVDVLNDLDFVQEMFPKGAFWLKIGKDLQDEFLLAKMQMFYERVDDVEVNQPFPTVVDLAKCRLEKKVKAFKNSMLLILDDVWEKSVIDAFNIGVKVLVTCSDSSIMDGFQNVTKLQSSKRPAFFFCSLKNPTKIPDGLTSDESLELLAKMTGVERDKLPAEAEKIHIEAHGLPIVISLVGGSLAGNDRPQKWKLQLKKLKEGKMNNQPHPNQLSATKYPLNLSQTMSLSFESLDPNTRELYKRCVVFPKDVAFSSYALGSLFSDTENGLFPWDTDDITKLLTKKSLLVRHEDESMPNAEYMFSLHRIQHDFLFSRTTPEERKRWNDKLLKWYFSTEHGRKDFAPFRDQYFMWHIGHHLMESSHHEWFKIFVNLDFVAAKISATGPADLLNDYVKYRRTIREAVQSESNTDGQEVLQDFDHFVRMFGHELEKENADVVQLALSMHSDSVVKNVAKQVIADAKERVYFETCSTNQKTGHILTKPLTSTSTKTACLFLPKHKAIFIGDELGKIELWNAQSGARLLLLNEHDPPGKTITALELACNPDEKSVVLFVSTSADGTAKKWEILFDMDVDDATHKLKRRSRHVSGNSVSSAAAAAIFIPDHVIMSPARVRRSSTTSLSVSVSTTQLSSPASSSSNKQHQTGFVKLTFDKHEPHGINCCAIDSRKVRAATGDSCGVIRVWLLLDGVEVSVLRSHIMKNLCGVTALAFRTNTEHGSLNIIGAGYKDSVVRLWDWKNATVVLVGQEHRKEIVGIHFIHYAVLLLFPSKLMPSCCILPKPTNSFLTSSDVSPDEKYLVVGTKENEIILWELSTQTFLAFHRPHQSPLTMLKFGRFPLKNKAHLLSVSCDTALIHDVNEMSHLLLSPNFDARWISLERRNQLGSQKQGTGFVIASVDCWAAQVHLSGANQGFHATFEPTSPNQAVSSNKNEAKVAMNKSTSLKKPSGASMSRITCISLVNDKQVAVGLTDGIVVLCRHHQSDNLSAETTCKIASHERSVNCVTSAEICDKNGNHSGESFVIVSGCDAGMVLITKISSGSDRQKPIKVTCPSSSVYELRIIRGAENNEVQIVAAFLKTIGKMNSSSYNPPEIVFRLCDIQGITLREFNPLLCQEIRPNTASNPWKSFTLDAKRSGAFVQNIVIFDFCTASNRFVVAAKKCEAVLYDLGSGESVATCVPGLPKNEPNASKNNNSATNSEHSCVRRKRSVNGKGRQEAVNKLENVISTAIAAKEAVFTAVKFSPDGDRLVTGESSGIIKAGPDKDYNFVEEYAHGDLPSHDEDYLNIPHENSLSEVWSSADGILLHGLSNDGKEAITDLIFSSCGLLMAAGGITQFSLFNLELLNGSEDQQSADREELIGSLSQRRRSSLTAIVTRSLDTEIFLGDQCEPKLMTHMRFDLGSNDLDLNDETLAILNLRKESRSGRCSTVPEDRFIRETDGCRCNSVLHNKRGPKQNNSPLLKVYSISNGPVRRIFASPDFHEFATVDDAGTLHLLKVATPSVTSDDDSDTDSIFHVGP